MHDSTGSIEYITSYLEALGFGPEPRARRHALQLLNSYRAKSDGEVDMAQLLRSARERVMLAESLVDRPLPTEIPTRMPPQSFRYGGHGGARDTWSRIGWREDLEGTVKAGSR